MKFAIFFKTENILNEINLCVDTAWKRETDSE